MKEIPKRQNLRRKGKESEQIQQVQIKEQSEHIVEQQAQPIEKTKKIHHQTLKAMERRKKAEEQKMKAEKVEAQKQHQEMVKVCDKKQQKSQKSGVSRSNCPKQKLIVKTEKGGRKCHQNNKKAGQSQSLLKYLAPLNNQISAVPTMTKQKFNDNSDGNKRILKKQEPSTYPSKASAVLPEQEALLPSSQLPDRLAPTLNSTRKSLSKGKMMETTELTYYNQHYDNIFDVLIPLDDIEEQYLIFDKNRQVQYWNLVEKVQNKQNQMHEQTNKNQNQLQKVGTNLPN